MRNIQVSYVFEVHKFVDIPVDELADYLDENNKKCLECVAKKYIEDYKNDCMRLDSSDELDYETTYCEIVQTIDITEDEYLDEDIDDFTIEDLIELKNSKV